MAIKKDLSELAPTPREEGEPPVPNPLYGPALAQAWFDTVDTTERAKAGDTRLRNSWAGFCTRQVQYEVMGVEKTNPLTPADFWRFNTGHLIHDLWQDVMEVAFPNCEREVKITYPNFDSSGHIDLVLRGDTTIACELKTINGYGFKMAVGARGPAEGPKFGHRLQAALNGVGVDADEIVLVYLSLENLSPPELKRLLGRDPEWMADHYHRFCAEWRYPREVYEPWAEAEMRRLTKVLAYTDEGRLVPRFDPEMPAGARITDPAKGMWQREADGAIVEAGSCWRCDYCSFRDRCITDGA